MLLLRTKCSCLWYHKVNGREYIVNCVCLSVCLFICKHFLCQRFLSIYLILKFDTKLDSDELYCGTKTATNCLSVPLFVHFSFSNENFCHIFLRSVFKFCVHLQVGKLYRVNENKSSFCLFLSIFHFFPSVTLI